MSNEKVYVGTVGLQIILDVGQDVTAATLLAIDAKRPDGSAVSWPAEAEQTAAIKYITRPGDLNQPGPWTLQARMVLPGWEGLGAALPMYVRRPFEQ